MAVAPVCLPVRLHWFSPCRIAKTFTFATRRSGVVRLCGPYWCGSRFPSPSPARDLGHVVAVLANELLMVDELVSDRLLGISRPRPKLWYAVDHIAHQVEAIEIVEHAHVEGCGRCAFFLVAAHMNVIVAIAPVGQSVNQPRVTVKGKDDGLVCRKENVKLAIRDAMRMLVLRL